MSAPLLPPEASGPGARARGPVTPVDAAAAAVTLAPAPVSAARLVMTLAVAGALAGLLLAFVHAATLPAIEAHRRAALEAAIREVLHDPAGFEPLVMEAGALRALAPGEEAPALPRVWRGLDADGRTVGYAIPAEGAGFQDVVGLLFGYDPRAGRLLGMKVLESKETPGLGDKIEKDAAFVGQFEGREPPLEGVRGAAGDLHQVQTITGATISARTVIRLINEALVRWKDPIEAAEAAR